MTTLQATSQDGFMCLKSLVMLVGRAVPLVVPPHAGVQSFVSIAKVTVILPERVPLLY